MSGPATPYLERLEALRAVVRTALGPSRVKRNQEIFDALEEAFALGVQAAQVMVNEGLERGGSKDRVIISGISHKINTHDTKERTAL